ncbi:MAG TPA: BTAD domain-containing putative transcriptional regulator [Acidimicrobiia bacterium]|nr:BTAD domain-containing putative transcriptional regulator [Acidimicrobiia bacterium]
MWFGALGPLLVRIDDGLEVEVGPRQRRMLLCRLLVDANRVVSSDQLIDALWGEHPPLAASGSLQAHISRLRNVLGDGLLQTRTPGYVLRVGPDSFDRDVFERLLVEARRDAAEGALVTASSRLKEGLGFWRGTAFEEAGDESWAVVEVRRLEELRVTALEERMAFDLQLGRHAELISELETLVADHPMRERFWHLLMLGYYHGGRQAEALRAYRRAKEVLAVELGIDPSIELQELEGDILNQDPRLTPPSARTTVAELRSPQTLTLLMSEIQSSASLLPREGEDDQESLTAHDAVLAASMSDAGGRIVKHQGRGLLALFPLAHQAVIAAVNAQRGLGNLSSLGEPVRARIAIHTGEGWERDGDLFGPLLNVCARLIGAAHGGQTVVSAVAAELAQPILEPGVELVDLGQLRLPGVTQPQQVFQVVAVGLGERFPPLRALGVARTNLAAQLSTFVGRDPEMRLIGRKLREHRLVTITGPGGCGKTRLALQVGADAVPNMPDGVWQVELASVTDPEGFWPELARVLGVQEVTDDLKRAVLQMLAGTQVLIILDNCEHLIDQIAESASEMLSTVEGLKILATSREPLAVSGEQLIPLSGMGVPETDMAIPALASVESIRLFSERAQAVLPTFELTSATAASVVEICRRVDGLPLAVELAAAHLRDMTPAAIAKSLIGRLDVLSSNLRTAAPRHRTLDAAISWSYDALLPHERALYRRLSVFGGRWLLEAAQEVCPDEEHLFDYQVPGIVASLVDKSLVIFDPTVDPPLYSQLSVVRQHAAARLATANESLPTMARMAHYISRLVEEAERFEGPDQEKWLSRFDIELPNLGAALEWAVDNDPGLSLTIAADCFMYWVIRGRIAAGRQLIETVVAAAPQEATRDLAATLSAAGGLAISQGDPGASESFYLRSVDMYRRIGDVGGVASTLNNLSIIAEDRSDLTSARDLLTESLALVDSIDDRTNRGLIRRAGVLTNLGSVTLALGDVEQSGRHASEAVRLSRSVTDKWSEAWALILTALTDRNVPGKLTAAEAHARAAHAIAERLDDAITTASAAEALAEIALIQERPTEAIEWLEHALRVREDLQDSVKIAAGHTLWAKAHLAMGDNDQAGEQLVLALEEAIKGNHRFEAATALEVAASLLTDGGNKLIVAEALAVATSIRRDLGRPVLPADKPFLDTLRAHNNPGSEARSTWNEIAAMAITEIRKEIRDQNLPVSS